MLASTTTLDAAAPDSPRGECVPFTAASAPRIVVPVEASSEPVVDMGGITRLAVGIGNLRAAGTDPAVSVPAARTSRSVRVHHGLASVGGSTA